jgi:hypothetical protein
MNLKFHNGFNVAILIYQLRKNIFWGAPHFITGNFFFDDFECILAMLMGITYLA